MTKRASLSKKLRFQVFKRDEFTCAYCGRRPPDVTLEADHVIAVANGGANSIDNLITSCRDCNRGKGAEPLECVPHSLSEKIEAQQEKQDQLKALDRLIRQQRKREESQIDEVEKVFQFFYEDREFSDHFRISVKTFVVELGVDECILAMHKACGKTTSSSNATKYFCGICWNKIRERKNG